ncbi:Permease of the drug/metabolite transporter (DMT) superfamily [Paracoccus thiocyanatus]|uniref:Permease of the drug/metabolite transporter (DMT) superfamily n=1 Tax=Paracoccus thiocyanatus TaxID=34006 RepID=A0A1N6XRK7_9RHOB|nr:DMT family transporter [Paracoccus thiocyanatus]SIR04962.1 Permease of the drug/metabolite transporter (DMT) superfamily [Paracoccus thiocyanatus]
MDSKAILMGVGFAVLWASAFTATRVIVTAAPPLTALVIRFALAAAVAIPLARAMGQDWRLTRGEWRTVVLFGLCQNALYLGFSWVAMQYVEASVSAIIASMMPLAVAFLGWLLYAERLRPIAVAGLVAGVLGVGLIMGVRLQHGLDLWGVALCLIGMVALTFATLAARGAGGSRNMMMIVGLQMAVGSVALLVPAALMDWGRPVEWSVGLVGAFAYTVLAPGIGATWLWFRLVNRIGAVRAAAFHFLSPIFGVGIAAALLGERFGVSDVVGALIVAAGILAVQMAKLPPTAAAHPPGPVPGRAAPD